MEIKVGIAYEGWERIPHQQDAYRLVGKRVYMHGHDRCPFWEGASLVWFRHWDPSGVHEVIVGGDGPVFDGPLPKDPALLRLKQRLIR